MLECVIIDDDSVGLYHLVTVYRLTSAVACGNGRGCKKKRKKALVKKKLEHLKIGCAVPKKGAGRNDRGPLLEKHMQSNTRTQVMYRCTAATVVGHNIIAVCCESVTDIFTSMNIVQFDVTSEILTRMPMYHGYAGPLVIAELVDTIYIFGKDENYTQRYHLRSHRDTRWPLFPRQDQLLKEEICCVFPIHSGSAVGALGKDLQVPAV